MHAWCALPQLLVQDITPRRKGRDTVLCPCAARQEPCPCCKLTEAASEFAPFHIAVLLRKSLFDRRLFDRRVTENTAKTQPHSRHKGSSSVATKPTPPTTHRSDRTGRWGRANHGIECLQAGGASALSWKLVLADLHHSTLLSAASIINATQRRPVNVRTSHSPRAPAAGTARLLQRAAL